jgi:hypothetical protein
LPSAINCVKSTGVGAFGCFASKCWRYVFGSPIWERQTQHTIFNAACAAFFWSLPFCFFNFAFSIELYFINVPKKKFSKKLKKQPIFLFLGILLLRLDFLLTARHFLYHKYTPLNWTK